MKSLLKKTTITAPAFFAAVLLLSDGATDARAQTTFLSDGGRVTLEADGVIEWNREEFYYAAEDNVRLSRGGWHVRADRIQAHYSDDDNDRALSGDLSFARAFGVPVTAESDDGTRIAADEIQWWPLEARLEALGDAAELTRRDGGRLTASGSLMWWESLEGRPVAEARGGVMASGGGGETLRAERIRAVFSGATGKIEEYQAFGDVSVERADGEIAKSRWARYDVGGERIVLEGGVRLEREGQILRGERAEMDLASGVSVLLPGEGGRVEGRFDTDAEQ
ncbi:MAG: hypothetical protein MPJ52_01635 [Alphaproteobacteria bacterium]|nr:hypothetical protein [Alphaproteobacteria bacterium]